jgi:PAS domain-containing protein
VWFQVAREKATVEARVLKPLAFESAEGRVEAFRALTERFAAVAGDEGVEVVPYWGNGPRHFAALPERKQRGVLAHFHRYVTVAEITLELGSTLSEDRHFLWQMFRQLGVHPAANLLDRVARTGDEVVEIYDANFVQIYRNLRFFRHCSYSLDELLSVPFWQLFARDPRITGRILAIATEYFSGKRRDVFEWDLGRHTVEEIYGPKRYSSVVDQRLVAPLFDAHGRVEALLNTIREISTVSLGSRRMSGRDTELGTASSSVGA